MNLIELIIAFFLFLANTLDPEPTCTTKDCLMTGIYK